MRFIQPLPEQATDIIGDIHGEYEALMALLDTLGYSENGHHPQARKLVFTGDKESVECPECATKQVKKLMSCASFMDSGIGGACTSGTSSGFS